MILFRFVVLIFMIKYIRLVGKHSITQDLNFITLSQNTRIVKFRCCSHLSFMESLDEIALRDIFTVFSLKYLM